MFKVKLIDNLNYCDSHFFTSAEFISYQSEYLSRKNLVFGVMEQGSDLPCAYVGLAENGSGSWSTPIVGAFGGVTVQHGTSLQLLEALVYELPQALRNAAEAKSIIIKQAPCCFTDDSGLISNMLYRGGWKLSALDINYHLNISSVDVFLKNLNETKRKFIRRLEKAGAIFTELPRRKLAEIYKVISDNRAGQGYPMTMQLSALESLADNFPQAIRFFGVELEGQLVAGAICISITPEYMYVFYWGEAPSHRKISPVLLLARSLVDYCERHNISILDIGTSSLNSELNEGLCAFKSSLGCKASPKLTFIYNYES